MALKVSTFKLAISSIENYKNDITLKSRAFKYWLIRKGYSYGYIAAKLGMNTRNLRKRLYMRRPFHQSEIEMIVRLLGARAAINIIWFPTLQEKRKIQKYVWSNYMVTYNSKNSYYYETPTERKKRIITAQEKESGEDWEQSVDFEKSIFKSAELPDRRFMRRLK